MKHKRMLAALLALGLCLVGCREQTPEETQPLPEPEIVVLENPAMEEQVILEVEGVRVTALKYAREELDGETLRQGFLVRVENENEFPMQVLSSWRGATVNGCNMPCDFGVLVPAEGAGEAFLGIDRALLYQAGISEIRQFSLPLDVTDDYGTGFAEEAYTREIRTAHSGEPEEAPKIPGTVLIDQDGFRVIGRYVTGEKPETLYFYVDNDLEEEAMCFSGNFAADGVEANIMTEDFIEPHNKTIILVENITDYLKNAGAKDLDTLSLTFVAKTTDNLATLARGDDLILTAE